LALLGLNFPRLFIETWQGKRPALERAINPCPEGNIYIQRFGADSKMVHRDDVKLPIIQEDFCRRPTAGCFTGCGSQGAD